MLSTLALIVIAASLLLFFSQEFGSFIAKFGRIPGIFILVPLIAASWLAEHYADWIFIFLVWLRKHINYLVQYFNSNWYEFFALFGLALVMLGFAAYSSHKKKTHDRALHPVIFIVWWMIATLLVV